MSKTGRSWALAGPVCAVTLLVSVFVVGRCCIGPIGVPILLLESRLKDGWTLIHTDLQPFHIELPPETELKSMRVLSPGLGATVRIDGELRVRDVFDGIWNVYLRCRWEEVDIFAEDTDRRELGIMTLDQLRMAPSDIVILRGEFGEIRFEGRRFAVRWSNA